jgi:hexosaminidase
MFCGNLQADMDALGLILLPRPRSITADDGTFTFKRGFGIFCPRRPEAMMRAAEALQADLKERFGFDAEIFHPSAPPNPVGQAVIKVVSRERIHAQGYRLQITSKGILIDASYETGAFYAVMTLRQIVRQCGAEVPCCTITDYPDFPSRGVMLDVSRDRVPTMDTLYQLVDQFAELKLNHLELYTEHTFAYSNHREVWAEASPMTADEIIALDHYCRRRFVELVPNQNSFGHLHRWLKLDTYRHLAESPDGYVTPWNEARKDPMSLNPVDPASIALIKELYEELLPNFTSRRFNVGCDETFDIGQGRSKEVCDKLGKGRVYLEYLLKIHELVRGQHGRTMHFWGDIILKHRAMIPALPHDVVALVWGYEADHPFADECPRFAEASIPFFVCPGTSGWNSIAGRTDNALVNLKAAAEQGIKHGAVGYLITDWGDNGHWQPMPVSLLPIAAGAACAWNQKTAKDVDLMAATNLHVFRDKANRLAQIARDLGNAHQKLELPLHNASTLFRLLHQNSIDDVLARMDIARVPLAREAIETAAADLYKIDLDRKDAALMRDEFSLAANMMLHACDRAEAVQTGKVGEPKTRAVLRDEITRILTEFHRLWLARSRPGGLKDSLRVLGQRLREYT